MTENLFQINKKKERKKKGLSVLAAALRGVQLRGGSNEAGKLCLILRYLLLLYIFGLSPLFRAVDADMASTRVVQIEAGKLASEEAEGLVIVKAILRRTKPGLVECYKRCQRPT